MLRQFQTSWAAPKIPPVVTSAMRTQRFKRRRCQVGSFATGLGQRQVRVWSAMPLEAEVGYLVATQQERTDGLRSSPICPPVASRPRCRRRAIVSAPALAVHLDCMLAAFAGIG